MNKKIIIFMLIIAVLVVAGCNQRPGPVEIYTGTKGATIDFANNVPPPRVFEGQNLTIVAEIWNQGAYDLSEGTEYGVVQLDYDPLYFQETRWPNVFRAYGKSQDHYIGERITHIASELQVKKIHGTRESPITKLTLSSCYPYETTLTKEVCIDTDYLQEVTNPVCRNPGIYSLTSQGAPVAVRKIEADMIPTGPDTVQPVFRITLQNMDDGLVLYRDPFKSVDTICSPNTLGTTSEDINILEVEAWLGSEQNKLQCMPNLVRLWQNEAEVTCTVSGSLQNPNYGNTPSGEPLNLQPGRNYMTFLTVKAKYVYRNLKSKDITIYRLNR